MLSGITFSALTPPPSLDCSEPFVSPLVSSHSALQFRNVFSWLACLLVCAVYQGRELFLEDWETGLVTELQCRACHGVDEKRAIECFFSFSMVPFISSSRLLRVTDAQLLPHFFHTFSLRTVCAAVLAQDIPFYLIVYRRQVLGEDRLCKPGFQKKEL